MNEELWTAVDNYFGGLLLPDEPALAAALRDSEAAGLPAIQISAPAGAFLRLLVRLLGAKQVLEIGTLGGYSTIWLARGMGADGRLVTLEADPHHGDVARVNIDRAGLSGRVEVWVGPALETLPQVAEEIKAPFDMVFIDADKENNPHYFQWALELTRPGGLIVVDNVVRGGRVADGDSDAGDVVGTRRMLAQMAAEGRIEATALQTVGSKGYDGLAIALVTGP